MAKVLIIIFAVLSVLTGVTINLEGLNLRPDQIFLPILLYLTFVMAGAGRHRRSTEREKYSAKLVRLLPVVYVVINFLSSSMYSLDVANSYRICVWLGLSVGAFFVVLYLLEDTSITFILKVLTVVAAAESAYGVCLLGLYNLGVIDFGIHIDPVGNIVGAVGTHYEANIFGSYLMVSALINFGLVSTKLRYQERWIFYPTLLIILLGLLFSFTRAAWVGLAIGLGCLMVASTAKKLFSFGRLLPLSLLGSLMLLLIFYVSPMGETLAQRAMSLSQIDTGTASFRLTRIVQVMEEVPDAPFLGHGTNSFGHTHEDRSQNYAPDYMPSLFFATLYDVGIIGLGVLVWFFGLLCAMLLRAKGSVHDQILNVALFAGIIALLVAYQATNAIWFSYNWILLAICVAQIERSQRSEQREEQTYPLVSAP